MLFAASAAAQSAANDLRNRLLDKPLFLRCLCGEDKLRFDEAGQPVGKTHPISWTLSGIEITAVDVGDRSLALQGRRVGLKFPRQDEKTLERIPLQLGNSKNLHDEEVRIEIAAPANHDYAAVLDAVFTPNMEDLAASLPAEWKLYAARNLHGPPLPANWKDAPGNLPADALRRTGGPVRPPVVQHMAEPEFSTQARALKIAGNVLVSLIVETDGSPSHVEVVRPRGMGLDEKAVQAVSAYQFKPAMADGVPVRVELNVEVNFQIF